MPELRLADIPCRQDWTLGYLKLLVEGIRPEFPVSQQVWFIDNRRLSPDDAQLSDFELPNGAEVSFYMTHSGAACGEERPPLSLVARLYSPLQVWGLDGMCWRCLPRGPWSVRATARGGTRERARLSLAFTLRLFIP